MRLADAALACRDTRLRLLAKAGVEPVFSIGIDYGPALGATLGEGPRVFNLWGEVIRTAGLMAGTASEGGSIQVSERAYQQLQGGFLFRPRGVFFVPLVGIARTFILAGRRWAPGQARWCRARQAAALRSARRWRRSVAPPGHRSPFR